MKIKDRLHRAFSLVVLSVLSATGIIILVLTRSNATVELNKELSQTSFLIYKVVQTVFDLNEKMLLGNLKVLEANIRTIGIDETITIDSDAEHYITRLTDYVRLPLLTVNGKRAFGDVEFVDGVARVSGGNVSVLQLIPQGLLQIATNIRNPDGRRATQLYYPNDDDITRAIRDGRTFIGKAFEMSEWYIVVYKPVFVDGKPIGAIHVGIKPDIADLRKHILDIKIGRTGSPYIVDTEGILVIAAEGENENVYHLPYIKKMIDSRGEGKVAYREPSDWPDRGEEVIGHYRYLPEMDWIIVASSYKREFFADQEIITWITVMSMIIAFGAAVLVSYRVSDNLTRPIQFLTDSMNAVKDLKFDFSDFSAIERIKSGLKRGDAKEEEIIVMADAYYTMLDELEGAQRQIVSKHRRFREMEISKKVSAMINADFETLQGFEVAARSAPSEEAAGYYFDRTVGPYGQTWYVIGHAKTRSLAAGLIMMMAQSAISSITKSMPDATVVEIVEMVNGFLVDGLKARTDLDEMLSIAIVIMKPDGWFHYAGKERRLAVYRSADGRCRDEPTEPALRTTGVDAGTLSRTLRLRMGGGDLLVLGSDDLQRPEADYGGDKIARLVEEFSGERAEELAARLNARSGGERGSGRGCGTVVVIRKY